MLDATSELALPESSLDASFELMAASLPPLDASPEPLLPDPLPPELPVLESPLDESMLDPSSELLSTPPLDASLPDASSGLPLLDPPLLEPPLDASPLDASSEPMPELLPDPLLLLPELPAPPPLDEEPEPPLPARAPSPNVPSVEASTVAETSPVLPPQPHTASAAKSAAPGTIPRRTVRRMLMH
jgi:hypothetical protein